MMNALSHAGLRLDVLETLSDEQLRDIWEGLACIANAASCLANDAPFELSRDLLEQELRNAAHFLRRTPLAVLLKPHLAAILIHDDGKVHLGSHTLGKNRMTDEFFTPDEVRAQAREHNAAGGRAFIVHVLETLRPSQTRVAPGVGVDGARSNA